MITKQHVYESIGSLQSAARTLYNFSKRSDGYFITQMGLVSFINEIVLSYRKFAETLEEKDAEIVRLKAKCGEL